LGVIASVIILGSHHDVIFGVVGFLMKKFEYEAAPLILAFVLSPMIEVASGNP